MFPHRVSGSGFHPYKWMWDALEDEVPMKLSFGEIERAWQQEDIEGKHEAILTICVISASNLPKADVLGTCDPYVKVKIGKGGGQFEYVTDKRIKTLDPVWNETFDLPIWQLDNCEDLTIELWDWDRLTKDDLLGTGKVTGQEIRGVLSEASASKNVEVVLYHGNDRVKGKNQQESRVSMSLSVKRRE
mmetsp:Transcript_48591/g.152427  ORF Transcript_48591/g.152427 Transcript_48591/m.152427 type:complete len:188 (-) Transcript_48591:25-588(-)